MSCCTRESVVKYTVNTVKISVNLIIEKEKNNPKSKEIIKIKDEKNNENKHEQSHIKNLM